MISASQTVAPLPEATRAHIPTIRRAIYGDDPAVFTDIYQDDSNIVVWQRHLSKTLLASVSDFLQLRPTFKSAMTVTPQSVLASVRESLGDAARQELSENVAELVDMFCCLFELKRAGLRITALDHAMCSRFHVDRVPCRLVTTYCGVATEWLPHQCVHREGLGAGSKGTMESQARVYENKNDIQQLNCGDVALLKGELWEGNESAGLVHRSPVLSAGENRFLVTLDFIN